LSSTLERYEKSILNAYDGIVPISPVDAPFFIENSSKPVLALPTGINPDKLPVQNNNHPDHALFHIGAMNWMPNEEGIRWFTEQVWPIVHNKLPHLKVHLAGREMPDWLKNLEMENVIIEGEVENAYDFIQSKSILIAPLFSGSGIRIKIIESMALAKAVISTSIGAEGINYTHNKNILIANTAEEFASAIEMLYADSETTRKIGLAARNLILEEHNTPKIIQQLVNFYQHIL
jgi:glycosyltransferase involved in cell wall biosynthesis